MMLGFEQPSRGEVLRLDGQEWRPVVVAEDREGFVVRDRRRILRTTPEVVLSSLPE